MRQDQKQGMKGKRTNLIEQFSGLITRIDYNRWAKKTSEWTPRTSKRVKGRPIKMERQQRKNMEACGCELHKIELHDHGSEGCLPAVT